MKNCRPPLLLATVLGLLIAAPALAVNYWVNPSSGNDASSGSSVGTAWRTITKAVTSTTTGDRIHLMSGTHAGTITGPSGTVWMGDALNDTAAVVSNVSLGTNSNMTLKWFKVGGSGTLRIDGGDRDSLYKITIRTSGRLLYMTGQADNNTLAYITGSTTGAPEHIYLYGSASSSDTSGTTRFINKLTMNDCWFKFSSSLGNNSMVWRNLKAATISRNRFFSTHGNSSASMVRHFQVLNSTFTDNYYEATSTCTSCDEGANWTLRDLSNYNTFVRDTILITGSYSDDGVFMTSTGTYGGAYNNTFISCVIAPKEGGLLQAGAPGYRFFDNQIVTDTFGWGYAGQSYPNLVFKHNTVVSVSGNQAFNSLGGGSGQDIESNIFFSDGSAAACDGAGNALVELAAGTASRDSNLYFRTSDTDQRIYVGTGCTGVGATSAWGDPKFAAPLDFNTIVSWIKSGQSPLTLQAGSWALAATAGAPQWARGYVGALPSSGLGGDVTPPAPVNDLGASP